MPGDRNLFDEEGGKQQIEIENVQTWDAGNGETRAKVESVYERGGPGLQQKNM